MQDLEEMVNKLKDINNISRKLCRRTVLEKFSQKRMVKEYIEVYSEILERQ